MARTEAIGGERFETALGMCGIAWTVRGICRVVLPGGTLPLVGGPAPPAFVTAAIERIRALLDTGCGGFEGIPLDLSGARDFAARVYAVTSNVEAGEVVTYGELARRLGVPGAARAVGAALSRNPVPLIVPCHRVVASDGGLGGFSAAGGVAMKRALLEIEARA